MVGKAVVTTRASIPAMKAAIDVTPNVQRCNTLQRGAPDCLVLLPAISFSFPGRSARSGTALWGKDERCSRWRTHPARKSGKARKLGRPSAELGPHGAQTALQEALFDFAGRQGHRGVKFSGRLARVDRKSTRLNS